jgi:hypothetical protein
MASGPLTAQIRGIPAEKRAGAPEFAGPPPQKTIHQSANDSSFTKIRGIPVREIQVGSPRDCRPATTIRRVTSRAKGSAMVIAS